MTPQRLIAGLLVVAAALAHSAEAQPTCSSPARSPACPDSICAKGLAALRACVGAERTKTWFIARPDCCRPLTRSNLNGPAPRALEDSIRALGESVGGDQLLGWRLEFERAIPKAPWANGTSYVYVDTLGTPLAFWGVDSCAAHPERCRFTLDFEGARKLARLAGLEPGIAPWEISFAWDPVPQRFVWMISNTLTIDAETSRRTGRELHIDANSRLLLVDRPWYTAEK